MTQEIVFGKKWFEKKQSILLWFLNTPIIKIWFRWVMCIHEYDCPINEKITNIQPNNFTFAEKMVLTDFIVFKNGKKELLDLSKRTHKRLYLKCKIEKGFAMQRTTDFRTHDKYSKRLYFAFKPLWYLLHAFDWALLDRVEQLTKLSFGFSTLTVYPQAGSGGANVTCDGYINRNGTLTWADVRDGAGSFASNAGATLYVQIQTTETLNRWAELDRMFFTFDTSTLTSGATISASVLSLYGNDKLDTFTTPIAPNINIYTNTQATNNVLVAADYQQVGTTAQCDTAITYSGWNDTGAYNDFTLNATGRGNISKTGVSKFSGRNVNYDVSNVEPTYEASKVAWVSAKSADVTGTSQDPKLVVTYTTVSLPTCTTQAVS